MRLFLRSNSFLTKQCMVRQSRSRKCLRKLNFLEVLETPCSEVRKLQAKGLFPARDFKFSEIRHSKPSLTRHYVDFISTQLRNLILIPRHETVAMNCCIAASAMQQKPHSTAERKDIQVDFQKHSQKKRIIKIIQNSTT